MSVPSLDAGAGYLVHRGLSLLPPHAPIMVILTLNSVNTKTGPMAQTWILCENDHPLDATRTGADASICGDCAHRGGTDANPRRSCYVQVAFGPANIWRSLRRGLYPRVPPSVWSRALKGETVRLGAYGDPLAAPVELWQALASAAIGWTGYTHQWQLERAEPYRDLLMASVDSQLEAKRAHAAGWRTFRVRDASVSGRALSPGEITCPASAEAGKRTTCEACLLCNGRRPGQAQPKSIVILPHGQWAVNVYRNKAQLDLLATPGAVQRLNPAGGLAGSF